MLGLLGVGAPSSSSASSLKAGPPRDEPPRAESRHSASGGALIVSYIDDQSHVKGLVQMVLVTGKNGKG